MKRATEPTLPEPKRADRWQPLRSGVLNLYKYDYEEFHYEDGRLLLRGNNGSGKSRVLAMQLPFLLDGEVSPARVEPDGDSAKRIEWNLLMGKHTERTGYTWIEFARRDEAGTCLYLTLGCGMKAVSGHTGLHSRWFFITPQRVGRDLFLQNSRTPLSRDRLINALGTHGQSYTKTDEYKRAVDQALFGLGARYGPLIELLLRLRRPQLSRKLEEEELSAALSDALPTLSASIIDEVAESFRSLQTDRETLAEFKSAREGVKAFLDEYTGYIRIVVRRRAAAVRSHHAAYEGAQRDVRDAEARMTDEEQALDRLEEQFGQLETALAGAEATERTLRESPEMKTAQDLQQAETAANQLAKALEAAVQDESRAQTNHEQANQRSEVSSAEATKVKVKLADAVRLAEVAAEPAGLTILHRQHLQFDSLLATDGAVVNSAESAIKSALGKRKSAIAALQKREAAVIAAEAAHAKAEASRQQAESDASAARESEKDAQTALNSCGTDFLSRYDAWRRDSRLVRSPDGETLEEAFRAWMETRSGESPAQSAISNAYHALLKEFAGQEADLKGRLTLVLEEQPEVEASIKRLELGMAPRPIPPPTRRADRVGRAGAPLWQVCDFRSDLPVADRAGIEAALEGAGLLDAWLLPDGRILKNEEDAFLVIDPALPKPGRSNLAEILTVTIDTGDAGSRALDEKAVTSALKQIGWGRDSGNVWIEADGNWRNGVLTGRWTKPAAEFIGAASRAAAIRKRLAELRQRQGELQQQRLTIEDGLARIETERKAAEAEVALGPSDEDILRAGFVLEAAAKAVLDSHLTCQRCTEAEEARKKAADEAIHQRDTDAADLGLVQWIGHLDELLRAGSDYEALIASVWPTARHLLSALGQTATNAALLQEARENLHEYRRRRQSSSEASEAARQRFVTLQASHGQTTRKVLEDLATATANVGQIKKTMGINRNDKVTHTSDHTQAKSDRTHAEEQRKVQESARGVAIAALQRVAEKRLLTEAHGDLKDVAATGWSVAQAVEIARRIEPLLAATVSDEAAWQKRQESILGFIQELRDQLVPHGHTPETHQLDDIVLVQCVFQGKRLTMTELLAAFGGELEEREKLLEAREREIIENHLLAEAAVELQKLIRAADAWRSDANAELDARPTSSGVKFRFQWEADAATRFTEVRPILLRKGELWTAADRAALARFLQDRIAAEQNAEEGASWRDALARALDYRRWHRFVVERQQDGKWKSLNRQTYGTGSTGEKALALTLPRFAAAAAHYRSAARTAPRLVMLDEAFAGIDPTMRAQCMGVLTEFDLDVVMTSELEWGCYATVPALAIYHLTTLPGVDAVAATRWVWNGRERKQIDPALPPAEIAGTNGDHPDEITAD